MTHAPGPPSSSDPSSSSTSAPAPSPQGSTLPSSSAALRLTAADFDAYLPERASSNAFTRPRLELKQRMLVWARGVAARLADLGIPLEITGSDEHPNVRNQRRVDCQRVFFWRDAEARMRLEQLIDRKRSMAARLGDPAPHKDHAYLALKLDSTHVEVSIEIHPEAWVDTRNLRARIADPERALELTSALEALPEQFELGTSPPPGANSDRIQAQRAKTDEIRAALDRVEQERHPFWLGWTIPREVALEHTELLDEQLEDAIVALGPVFKLIAWAPDNDMLVLDTEWQMAREERARAHEEAERDRAEWEARREGERKARPRPEDVAALSSLRRPYRREVPPPSTHGPRGPKHDDSAPSSRGETSAADAGARLDRLPLRKPARAIPRKPRVAADVDPTLPIERGARVEVRGGPFAGKIGVVQELDGRGSARVLLGLLAVRLDVKDLVVSVDRDRPLLGSSHRKPLPAR